MNRKHDADLCDRIRALEKRIEELEARPHTTYITNPPHYCYWGCPIHQPATTGVPITWNPPYITWSGSSSDVVDTITTFTATGTGALA